MEERVRPRQNRRDANTAWLLLLMALCLAGIAWAGASVTLSVVSGPRSMLDSVRTSVRELLVGTSEQSAEDRRARLDEAVRKAEQRHLADGAGGGATENSTAAAAAATPTLNTPVAVVTTPTPTPAPDDRRRLRFILGQAITSYSELPPDWATNVEVAASLLNDQTIPPGQVFSFAEALGPVTTERGFQLDMPDTLVWPAERPGCVAGGVCQVSTTLVQAAFAAGIQIVEHHHFAGWQPVFGEGPERLPGLDARVGDGADLKIRNNTDDWIRIEAWADGRATGVVLYGVDPGWIVQRTEPNISARVPPTRTLVRREAPTLFAGQDYTVALPSDGFTVQLNRTVIRRGQVIDRFQQAVRYEPMPGVLAVGVIGATPTPTPTVTPTPQFTPTPRPTPRVPQPRTPTPVDFDPTPFQLADGQVRVPPLVGLPEAEARRRIEAVGLANTFTNYQGPGDVPEEALRMVAPGQVLSQMPAPDTVVARGSTVYIAVRER